jgi:hypothetical protein
VAARNTEVAVAVTFGRKDNYLRALTHVEVLSVPGGWHPARLVEDRALIDWLAARFAQALRLSDRLSTLTQSLEVRGLRYCVFGGWVRDTVSAFHAMPMTGPPRDIDLVVRGIEVKDLLQNLPSDVRRTLFGGIQSDAEPIAFDIWPLHETFLIQYLGLAPTFESLLQSTDFTINAGLFFPRQGADMPAILDGGMLEALATRTLAFNGTFLPFPVMQCARLAAYAGKLSLELSPTVRTFMQNILADPARREQVLLGLRQNYAPSITDPARQVLERLMEGNR